MVFDDRPRVGHEVLRRILCIDAELDGVAAWLGTGERQRLTGSDAQLLLDQVDAGYGLGDRMLHLYAGVHLEEVELPILRQQELDGPRGDVIGRSGDGQRRGSDAGSLLVGQSRGRCLLDQLLVAPLRRAVALPDEDGVAVGVAHDLGFDVAGLLEVLLNIDVRLGKVGVRFTACGIERGSDFLGRVYDPQPFPTATVGGLDGERVAVLFAEALDAISRLERFHRPRNCTNTGLGGGHPRGDLVTHRGDRLRVGTHPDDPRVDHCLGEMCVLGEEPVAGMNRRGVGPNGHFQDPVDVEIRLGSRGGSDIPGLVGEFHVPSVAIELGVDGNGSQPELFGGPDDPDRDLPTIGNEH